MDKKDCPYCGETKSITEFGKNRRAADGLMYECKKCKRMRDKEYRSRPQVRAKRNDQSREYNKRFGHLYRDRYKINENKYILTRKKWLVRNPNATHAYGRLHWIIKRGDLPKASECTCARCGNQAAHYHHHNGYDDGSEFDVIPLCASCHRLEHSPRY